MGLIPAGPEAGPRPVERPGRPIVAKSVMISSGSPVGSQPKMLVAAISRSASGFHRARDSQPDPHLLGIHAGLRAP